jgi:2Fe-2S ferredoxin
VRRPLTVPAASESIMATIRISPSGETFPASPARSILNTLLAGGFPIDTVCGGRAQCGRCLIRVRSGGRMLNPRTPAEEVRLAALGTDRTDAEPRLACQSHARGDVEIEVVNIRGRKA